MEAVGYSLLFLLLMLSILLAGPPALYWSYIRVRRKGFRSPAAALILLASLAAAIGGAIALRTGNSRDLVGLVWRAVAVPTLMAAVALLVAVKVLPHRAARVFGERRTHFPFRGVGRLLEGSGNSDGVAGSNSEAQIEWKKMAINGVITSS